MFFRLASLAGQFNINSYKIKTMTFSSKDTCSLIIQNFPSCFNFLFTEGDLRLPYFKSYRFTKTLVFMPPFGKILDSTMHCLFVFKVQIFFFGLSRSPVYLTILHSDPKPSLHAYECTCIISNMNIILHISHTELRNFLTIKKMKFSSKETCSCRMQTFLQFFCLPFFFLFLFLRV